MARLPMRKASAFVYASSREATGLAPRGHQRASLFSSAARRFPSLAREDELPLEDTDKVFAAQWISHSELVLGTKCNKLLYYSTDTRRFLAIPMLRTHRTPVLNRTNCGINSIAISPSGGFLATGGENPDDVAVYRLPSFEPVALGQAHDDWIFTLTWISETVLVSGSRDGRVMAWDLTEAEESPCASAYDDSEGGMTVALLSHTFCRDEHRAKVRASEHNGWRDQFATLTCDGGLKLWDSSRMECFSTTHMKEYKDTVCMSYDKEHSFYAIGTQSSVVLVEPRAGRGLFQIESLDENWGVRSVSATDVILTIGAAWAAFPFSTCATESTLAWTHCAPRWMRIVRGRRRRRRQPSCHPRPRLRRYPRHMCRRTRRPRSTTNTFFRPDLAGCARTTTT
eukprot:Opistho-2@33201